MYKGETTDVWKENTLAYLESGYWELLVALKKEFGKEDNKLAKVAELK